MKSATRFVISAVAAALVACNALLGLEPLDFGDGAPDAAADGGDEGSASLDAGGADAPSDRTGNAAADAFRCSDAYDFCDDFEGTRTLQGAWSGVGIEGTGSLSIEAGVLRAEMQAAPSTLGHYAVLGRTLGVKPGDGGARRRIRIAFRANVQVCSTATPVTLANVGYDGLEVNVWVYVDTGVCSARILELTPADGGANYRGSGTLVVTTNAWHDYVLDLAETPDGVGGESTLLVDGEKVTLALTPWPTPSTIGHQFGAGQGTLAGTDTLVYLDDYRIDYAK